MRIIISTQPARSGARFASWEHAEPTEYWVSKTGRAWQLAGVRQTRRGIEEFWAPCQIEQVAVARGMDPAAVLSVAKERSLS